MKRTLMLAILWSVLLPGCGLYGQDNPRSDLLAARQVYSTTVNTLTVLRTQAAFEKDQAEALTGVMKAALASLDRWEAEILLAEKEGRKPDNNAVVLFLTNEYRNLLREMLAAQVAGQRYVANKGGTP